MKLKTECSNRWTLTYRWQNSANPYNLVHLLICGHKKAPLGTGGLSSNDCLPYWINSYNYSVTATETGQLVSATYHRDYFTVSTSGLTAVLSKGACTVEESTVDGVVSCVSSVFTVVLSSLQATKAAQITNKANTFFITSLPRRISYD